MRTLVVHTGAIGDFLLACPAFIALARETEIELAGDRSRLALAVEAKIARAAHSLDAIEFYSAFGNPSARLRTFLSGFERVVVFMRDPDGGLRSSLSETGAKRVDIFPGLPDAAWTRHASEYYAQCLGFENLPPLRLDIVPAGPSLDVVIHPGSGSPSKNWPIENFRSVSARLLAQGRRVTWCVGPAEIERGFDVSNGAILHHESLIELARCLATAELYIGSDSGMTHLAAALGVQTTVLFGPSDPRVWAPRGDNVCVLRGTPGPEVEQVLDAALFSK